MNEEATVHIVDDQQAQRESFAAVIRSKGLQVREYGSAEEFLSGGAGDWDRACLLIEAQLPGMSGLELQQRLATQGSSIPVVMTSDLPDVSLAVRAMQQGAVTFLQKPCTPEELWAGIELALQSAREQAEANQRRQDLRERFRSPSDSERTVLSRVIEAKSNKQIATELDLGLRTVELRRSNIMRKTGAANLFELMRLVIEVGFPDDLPSETLPAQSTPAQSRPRDQQTGAA